MADDLMSVLRDVGFSGQKLQMAYAIAMAEGQGDPHAFNGNSATGDKSYGDFQINMLGAMGPERLHEYGLSSNEDLFDRRTNARVAYQMSKGGTDWHDWSTFKNGAYKKYLGQSGASVAGGDAGTTAKAAPGDFTKSSIAPGLASQEADPFAPNQAGDPFAAPKAANVPGQNPTGTPPSTSFRDKVIATAMQQLGTPYSWGGGGVGGASTGFAQGAGTVGFDCSSLMMYAFGKNGFSLPRVSYDQLKQGQQTSITSLRPGDLVGFENGSHIALYLGNGRILEAPHTGASVRVRTLGTTGFDSTAFGVRLNLPGD